MNTEHFSEYTKLMLARMEDTPEEFTGDTYGDRWGAFENAMINILNGDSASYFSAFPAEEIGALIVKYKKIVQHQMFKQAIKTILEGNMSTSQGYQYAVKGSNMGNTVINAATFSSQLASTLNNLVDISYNNLTPPDVKGSGETISYGLASQALKKEIL